MNVFVRLFKGIGFALLALMLAVPSLAQVEDQISVYGSENATGYLQPLADAFGANLLSGLYHSAYIPSSGFNFAFEIVVMSAQFDDSDRTFGASIPLGFIPSLANPPPYEVPTVIGSGNAVFVAGQGGTTFTFPGGFDLQNFSIGVPQLRISGLRGTEGLVRFFAIDTGDAELGDIVLWGVGLRHSLSQHWTRGGGHANPFDVSIGASYQSFKMGSDDLTETTAFNLGTQVSRRIGIIEPYGGIAYDSFQMDVTYTSDASGQPEQTKLEFSTTNTVVVTLGLALRLGPLSGWADYNFSESSRYSFGVAIGTL